MVPFAVNRVAVAMSVLITPLRLCKCSCSRLHTPALTGRTGCLVAWPMARAAGLAAVRKLLDSPYMVYGDAGGVEIVYEEGVNRRYCDPTSRRRPRRLISCSGSSENARKKGKIVVDLAHSAPLPSPASPAYVAAPLAAFFRLVRSFQNGAESEGVVPRHISQVVEHVADSCPLSVPISHPCTEPNLPHPNAAKSNSRCIASTRVANGGQVAKG